MLDTRCNDRKTQRPGHHVQKLLPLESPLLYGGPPVAPSGFDRMRFLFTMSDIGRPRRKRRRTSLASTSKGLPSRSMRTHDGASRTKLMNASDLSSDSSNLQGLGTSGEPRRSPRPGGARRDRTDDLMLAKHALSQLSYGPFSRQSALKAFPRREAPQGRPAAAPDGAIVKRADARAGA
jgi:hypothetical protein